MTTMLRVTTAQLAALSSTDKAAVAAIDLSNSTETDFSVLAQFPNLAALNLSGSYIADLSPLAGLANLKWLATPLPGAALVALSGLTGLKWLNLSSTLIGAQLIPNGDLLHGVDGWFDPGDDTSGNPRGTFAAVAGGGLVLHGPYAGAGSPAISVVPGQSYRVTFRCYAGAGTQAVYLRFLYSAAAAGSNPGQITTQNMSAYHGFLENGSVAAGATDYSYDWTCPAGVYWVSAQVVEWAGGTADITVERVTVGSTLAPLSTLTALQALNLAGTDIADMSPLAGLTALTSLDLSASRNLTDVSPLASLTALKTLRLRGTPVTDTSALTQSGLVIER